MPITNCNHVYQRDNHYINFGERADLDNDIMYCKFTCTLCNKKIKLPATELLNNLFRKGLDTQVAIQESSLKLHKVWHDYLENFYDFKGCEYKHTGYELIERTEEWAEKWGEEVRIVSCDDNHFMSSIILLVEHRTETNYMGTTMLCIPQVGGQPIKLFLYPGHRNEFQRALRNIEARTEVVKRNKASDTNKKLRILEEETEKMLAKHIKQDF
jgi:hypothetical protein